MVRKAKWLSTVKKAFNPDSKEKKEQKLKKKLLENQNDLDSGHAFLDTFSAPPPPPLPVEVEVSEEIDEQNRNACSASAATTTDVPVVSAWSAPEIVQCATVTRFAEKLTGEVAAIRIQTAFRGYLAKRALRALRGLVRLKLLMEGPCVKRQAANTLGCMQTLSRVQSQIRARRIRMSEENQARQKQLLQKHAKEIASLREHAKEIASLRSGEEWDDSTQSKERVEANLLSKYEAATRRERALAYAYSHQQTWKNSTKLANPMFMDPSNPTWGWSWLERWMAGRPWESTNKEPNSNDNSSVKNANRTNTEGQVTKSFIRHQLNSAQPNSPSARTPRKNHNNLQSPSTPSKLTASSRKFKLTSSSVVGPDDDTKSVVSVTSDVNRRHSIAGSSIRDDTDSLGSLPSLPSYMVGTESAKARLKTSSQSPLGLVSEENGVPAKGSVKKRLSYPASPAPKPRRFSAPPKVENVVNAEIAVTNRS